MPYISRFFYVPVTRSLFLFYFFFFFNDTATTEIYTLSLHDALPICRPAAPNRNRSAYRDRHRERFRSRSEEHTSELQSQSNLVCRLLLEKKKKRNTAAYQTRKYAT